MSERISHADKKELELRDYQRQLHERTLSAQNQGHSTQQRLAFTAGGYGLLIKMTDAEEIMSMPAVTRVPGTHLWFKGLSNYRGKLISVIDLDCLISGQTHPSNQNQRLIILSEHFFIPCGLQVSQACGLIDLHAAQSNRQSENKHPWMDGSYVIDGQQWYELNLVKMQADPVFLQAHIV